jgi:parallel beta-helix repeat protein
VADNVVKISTPGFGIRVESTDIYVVTGNLCYLNSAGLNGIEVDASNHGIVAGNLVQIPDRHGISILDSSNVHVRDNYLYDGGQGTANTYDGIILAGNSDDCTLMGNVVFLTSGAGNRWRYGLNVSAATCDRTIYLGNTCRPGANFATGAFNDAGTGSINVWPGAAAPQGDNMV